MRRFVRLNNHEHTDLAEYLGTYVSDASGTLAFQEGALVQVCPQTPTQPVGVQPSGRLLKLVRRLSSAGGPPRTLDCTGRAEFGSVRCA